MSSSKDYHVIPAIPEHVPDILRLIKELAVYEKEPDAVVATEQMLHDNIFVHKYANVILAVEGPSPSSAPGSTSESTGSNGHGKKPEVIGMALWFYSFSTWLGTPGLYLEDLYITPSRRNAGIGKVLFGHLGRIAKEKNCSRMEWKVLKWNEPSIAFYVNSLKATPQSEWEWMRLEGPEEIGRLEGFLGKRVGEGDAKGILGSN